MRDTCMGDLVRDTCMGDSVRDTCMGDSVRDTCMGDSVRDTCMGDSVMRDLFMGTHSCVAHLFVTLLRGTPMGWLRCEGALKI